MVCQFRHTFIFTWSHFVPRCVFKLLLDFKLTSADFKQVNVGWVGSRNMIKKTLMRRRKVLKTTIIFQNIKWLQTVVLEQKFALQHASLRTGWNTIGSKARNISQKTEKYVQHKKSRKILQGSFFCLSNTPSNVSSPGLWTLIADFTSIFLDNTHKFFKNSRNDLIISPRQVLMEKKLQL